MSIPAADAVIVKVAELISQGVPYLEAAARAGLTTVERGITYTVSEGVFGTNVKRVLANKAIDGVARQSLITAVRTLGGKALVSSGVAAGSGGAAGATLLGLSLPAWGLVAAGASVLLVGGYIWSQSGDKPVKAGPAMSGPHPDRPGPVISFNADSYAVFLLTNVSNGSIWVGQESALKEAHTYDFAGGGQKQGDGSTQRVTYEKKSGDFPTYDQAMDAYRKARTSPPRHMPLTGGRKAQIYGGDYWVDLVE